MRTHHVDTFAKALAARLTRRGALRAAGTGLAAGGFGSIGARIGRAQDAAPAATPAVVDGEEPEFLFVQTFAAGTWGSKPAAVGTFLLTLTGHTAQTIYFSDRPERIVGSVPTPAFLEALGFTPANPPNAALVAQTDEGEDIVVVELFNPTWTETFSGDGETILTYEARVLESYQEAGLAHLAARQADASLPESFGPASLFIDDCADDSYICTREDSFQTGDRWGPMCWSWTPLGCFPCPQDVDVCNQTYSWCEGQCEACNVGQVLGCTTK